MGAPMARNLAAAGLETRAYNRRPSARDRSPTHGVTVAGSAAEAVDGADVVVTMLSDGPAVEAVTDGLAFGAGAVWAQMSTVGIEASERLSRGPPRPARRSSTRRCSAPRRPRSRAS